MKISELIAKLEEIKEKDGDNLVIVDTGKDFSTDIAVEGQFYTCNSNGRDGYRLPRAFIIVQSVEE